VSKHVQAVHESSHDVEAVFGALTSPAWVARKAERLRDGTQLVRREEQPDGGVVLEVSRELPAGAPGFLERFLPKDGRVRQTDDWGPPRDGARFGTWRVEIPGAPARLGGTMRLEPVQGGTRHTIEGEVKVSVPLVGGKAEIFIGEMVVRLAGKEATLLKDFLSS
jgi:hypothetical protein